MTRPPSANRPAGRPVPDVAADEWLDGRRAGAIRAALTAGSRPAPDRLHAWVIATADAERAAATAAARQPDTTDGSRSFPDPVGIHASSVPARRRQEVTMSGEVGSGLRLVTVPVSPRPVGIAPNVAARRGRPASRWTRRGWPLVERLGVAALILGIASVLAGGDGGRDGLPAILTDLGGTTRQATPTVDPDAVAMGQGDAGRTGQMPGPGVSGVPEPLWRLPVQVGQPARQIFGEFDAETTVLVASGTAYFVERQGQPAIVGGPPRGDQTLNAVDAATGDPRWSVTYEGISQGTPLVAGGLVIVAVDPLRGQITLNGSTPAPDAAYSSTRGYVLAFDASTGAERWRAAVGLVGYQSPVYADGRVYLIDRRGDLTGLDVATGAVEWTANVLPVQADNPVAPASTSVSVAGGFVVVTSTSGITYAFRTSDAGLAWFSPRDEDRPSGRRSIGLVPAPVIIDGTVLVSRLSQQGIASVVAVDLMSGEERWAREVARAVDIDVAASDGVVVIQGGDYLEPSLRAVDLATGREVLWTHPLGRSLVSSPVVVAGTVYLSGSDGTVTALDLHDGAPRWSVQTAGEIDGHPFVIDGTMYVASLDGNVYAVRGGADGAPAEAPVDITDFPACEIAPRPAPPRQTPPATYPQPTVAVDGTPAATLLPDIPGYPGYPAIDLGDVLPLAPLAAETRLEIDETIRAMRGCWPPGFSAHLASYFSDDFSLRQWAAQEAVFSGYSNRYVPSASPSAIGLLPDGRIAYVSLSDDDSGLIWVFARVDGQWRVDEFGEISPDGRPTRG